MEAHKLKTIDDLLLYPDERVELIGGELHYSCAHRFPVGP